MSQGAAEQNIIIRDVETSAEMRAVERLQAEVWGMSDLDVVPLTQLVAAKACGGILVGAFDHETMVGFAYGFVSHEGGATGIHSHMLAVRPAYRNFNLGYKLKLAQRERALAAGFERMTWTFDPLQSLNAHFNFRKLGVIADRYEINFYGEDSSSFLHSTGTDRLWVTWLLTSRRVAGRLDGKSEAWKIATEGVPRLLRPGAGASPVFDDLNASLRYPQVMIEMPGDKTLFEGQTNALALDWRAATRRAFTEAFASDFLVEDFFRPTGDDNQHGFYLLGRGRRLADFA